MNGTVVGHVEWCQFARVERVPRAGEIVHAYEIWEEPGGGGGVAAVQLARLAGRATLFTAFGNDELGRQARRGLERLGVNVHAAVRPEPQRRAFIYVDERGERTITVLGDKHVPRGDDPGLPWSELREADGVYFVSGDAGALRAARQARVLVATARDLATLKEGSVELEGLVASGEDESERYRPGDLDPAPALVVTTSGALGGWAQPGGPFRSEPVPGPIEDTYGAGDSFAVGLTYGLANGLEREEALALAARCGAAALGRRGAHG